MADPRPPVSDQVVELLPGLHWLRLPMPLALGQVNLWLVREDEGWTAVDTGTASEPAREVWLGVLARHPVVRTVVTHYHADHLGNAGWLQARSGAPLWIAGAEFEQAERWHQDRDGSGFAGMLETLRDHGLPGPMADLLRREGNPLRVGAGALPERHQPLVHGQDLAMGGHAWRVIIGHGHSPAHASLYCQALGVLIAGDMVMPRLATTMAAPGEAPGGNPLGCYLEALDRLRALPEDTLVLPSHGRPFLGLHARLEALDRSHRDRCATLLEACRARPMAAAELLPYAPAGFGNQALKAYFGMGELLAHLIHLEQGGQVRRQAGAGGGAAITFCAV